MLGNDFLDMTRSAWVAITKYYRLEDLIEIYVSQFWRLEILEQGLAGFSFW